MEKIEVNKDWFQSNLNNKRQSQTALAKFMGLDKSALSRILSGGRKMQMDEATLIAQFFAVPVSEVLKHAGASVDVTGLPTKLILASIIDHAGMVARLDDAKTLPQSLIDRAHAALAWTNERVIAAQIRAATGPLAVLDDAVVLFRHTDSVKPDAIGALAICRLHSGEHILARIVRARKTGEAQIVRTSGETQEVVLHTATPVIVVLP